MATQLSAVVDRILGSTKRHSFLSLFGTGLFSGSLITILSITYAALIFSGPLSDFLSQGITIGFTSIIMVGLMTTLLSQSKFFVCQIDDDTAPVFALFLSLVIATLPASSTPQETLIVALSAIFAATLLSGVILLLFGQFKLGSFVQFLPYSVMGGYFAAVGWLLLIGAINMLTKIEFDQLENWWQLLDGEQLGRWLPAVAVGLLLRGWAARWSKGAVLGTTVLTFSAVFYCVIYALGKDSSWAMQNGYLLGPFADGGESLFTPFTTDQITATDWRHIFAQLASMSSIVLISLLSIVLCISAVSLSTREDLDPNHELRVSGVGNIFSAFAGGMMALPSVSVSKMSHELNPRANRWVGVIASLVAVMTFLIGMQVVAHIPKMVLGALLIYIGSGFVWEWLITGYKKFGAFEYSVIPTILIVSIVVGFLPSIVVGIIAAIILFVIRYSRIRVIRYQSSGANLRSNLVRDIEQNRILAQHGDQIHMFKLQGFLFFGTAGNLYRQVMALIDAAESARLKHVILDFAQVIGVDSSATLNFEKLAQRLSERRIYLHTTSLKPQVLDILRRGGLDLQGNSYLSQHTDLDQALEFCENEILTTQDAGTIKRRGIFERMADALPHYDRLHKLSKFLEKRTVEAGQILTEIGAESDEVFFLETCTASAYIIDSSNTARRVSGAGRGAIYGEIGFFLSIARTAKVMIDSPGELYALSRQNLKLMEKEEPELASALTHYLAQVVTERLVNTTQSLRAVM